MTRSALTIAGSDSGGGAGVQADLKTFLAFDVFGMSAITAVTAQNTLGVRDVHPVPPETVRAQIDACREDLPWDAAKTGMLFSSAIIEAVVEGLKQRSAPLVCDPVMVATSGDRLLEETAVETLKTRLLPLATCVTPNLPEAELLTGHSIGTEEEMLEAARKLLDLGPGAVYLKGGHHREKADDLLLTEDGAHWFRGPRLQTRATHGTGCTLSAALAAGLATDLPLPEAAEKARTYVRRAMDPGLNLGAGHAPLDHGVSRN